ncbi:hypothetical protein [Streptomyces sp. NPDC050388]|uniref:hypothetical protein n=1 Tax=Streptomyces sp. NPDC050388 TaxID=3155781 RepID=UPI003424347F
MTNDAPTGTAQSPTDRFRSRLLEPTLESARAIPFYERHWKGRDLNLDELPTVTKRQLLDNLASTLRPGAVPANVGHSTGTTGRPFFRVRGREEIKAYSEYLRSVRTATAARSGVPVPPMLQISGAPITIHGSVLPVETDDMRLAVDLFSAEGLAATVDLLTSPSLDLLTEGFQRVLSASPGGAVLLTQELDRRGMPTRELGIEAISVYNSALLPRQRSLLRRHWDARLVERFSLSEVLGGATLCYECGHYHLDPVVVPEVLDLDRDEPAADVGELVLTELHPFSQVQPMIRYRTGDLVRRTRSVCLPHELTFDYVGRARAGVFWGGELVLGEIEVLEAVEGIPGLAHAPVGEEREPVGAPLISLRPETRGDELVLVEARVEVVTSHEPGGAQNVLDQVHERLTQLLAERAKDGIPLRVVPAAS